MKRAAAYVRVSSARQSETSLETQLEVIENFASNGGIKIVAKYSDKITASGEKKRPAFSQMIEDALTKKFDMILVYKYDRFIRDEIEDQRLMKELEKKNVFVISCSERIDTSTPAGRLQRWIISGINRFYIENLKQEIYDKTTKVAEKAYYLGGTIPYGYSLKKIRDPEAVRNRKIYVINEEEAVIVRKIFEMFANGYSYREMVEILNKKGFKTRFGNSWTTSTIFKMLHNERYAGTYTFRKGRNGERKDVVRVEGGCPAIISEETFKKVQKRFYVKQYSNSPKNNINALCKGIIFCGVCGAPMIRNGSTTSDEYLCSRWKNKRDTQYVGIAIRKLDRFVLNYIRNIILSENLDFKEMSQSYNEEIALRDIALKEKIDSLELEKQELNTKIRNAIDAILNGSPLADALQEEAAKMKKEIQQITEKLKRIKEEGQVYITEEMLKEKYVRFREMLDGDPQIQRELILQLIDKIIVFPDGFFKIYDK